MNLRQLSSASRNYAAEHGDNLPDEWSQITNSLPKPELLYCPADTAHPAQNEWSQVDLEAVSYRITAPGILTSSPETAFIRCVVHRNSVSSRATLNEARPFDTRIPWSGIPTPALLTAREASLSLNCMSNLREIQFSAAAYASDHGNLLPTSFRDLADSDLRPAALRCPADALQSAPIDFTDSAIASANYVLDSPGGNTQDPSLLVAHCRIHGHFVTVEGLVTAGTDRYPPRLIVGHPLSRTVKPGGSTTLEVLTGDTALQPLRFQWRNLQPYTAEGEPFTNTVNIPGATNATLALTQVTAATEGFYDVIVTEPDGSYQLSSIALVRVEGLSNVPLEADTVCFNNLKQLSLAVSLYHSTHDETWPASLRDLRTFLGWPCLLYCPADTQRVAPETWPGVAFDNASYAFSGSIPEEPSTNVIATCRVHGYMVQAGGVISSDPPRFFPPRLSDSGLDLSVVTSGNKITILESSPNLVTWSVLATNFPGGSTLFKWTDPNFQPAGALFYRTRLQSLP